MVWDISQIFLFGGRFIFAPDATQLPLTIALILVPTIIFCQFVARYFLQYFYAGHAILIIVVTFAIWVSIHLVEQKLLLGLFRGTHTTLLAKLWSFRC